MAYAICRVQRVKVSEIDYVDKHNTREILTDNIKPFHNDFFNTYYEYGAGYYGNNYHTSPHCSDEGECAPAKAILEKRLKELNIRPRSNSNVLEYVLTVSKEFHEKANYSVQTTLEYCSRFLEKKHGEENIIKKSFHFDEENPHVHVVVAPIIEKEVKWKNRHGSGVKTELRLCSDDFIGGKDENNHRLIKKKLRQLQDNYWEYMQSMSRRTGIPIYRGLYSEEQVRKYTKNTNHLIAKLNQDMDKLTEVERKARLKEIEIAHLELEKAKETALKKKLRNKGEGWKKGEEYLTNLNKKQKPKNNNKGMKM